VVCLWLIVRVWK